MKKHSKEPHHKRSKYVGSSRQFAQWINQFEFEKTWFGAIATQWEERFNLRTSCFLFLFCISLSYLLFYEFDFSYKQNVGELAGADIKSPVSLEVTDLISTEEKRVDAERSIPPVFDYDTSVYDKISNRVFLAFQSMRHDLKDDSNLKVKKERFEELLQIRLSKRVFNWLKEHSFVTDVENNLLLAMDRVSHDKITSSLKNILHKDQVTLVGRYIYQGEVRKEFSLESNKVVDLSLEPQYVSKVVKEVLKVKPREKRMYVELVQGLLTPNLTLNQEETGLRKAKARASVLPVVISVKKNQLIVSKGSLVQPIHMTLLKEIQRLKSSRRIDFLAFNSALLLLGLLFIFLSYIRRFASKRIHLVNRDLIVMGSIGFMVIIGVKIFWFVGQSAFASQLGTRLPEEFFIYAAPVSFGAMLVGLLIPFSEVAWFFIIFMSVALGLVVESKFLFVLFSMVGGMVSIRGVYNCKKRNDIYFAGLRVGLVNALVIVTAYFILHGNLSTSWSDVGWLALAGLFSGIFASGVAMMLVPILESLFNYTTNVKLLELSNLDHPLLKEMVVKAPGTYHHSLMVGAMCEAGAESIGANPLLAKVMAYYHDIGKMEHAAYFIENQKAGHNPHDQISPHMSKTILIAHVKDGAELGMKHKLGKPIIDGILQHHGTTLISYFYNKALESQDKNIDQVSEEDFRYPGPKPQFKEAALCMIADSIEAAARCLDDPTTARLQNIVRNIIQRKFIDGQLDECELTLKDLSVIEESFERILLGIYHQRIDYPKSAGGDASSTSENSFQKSSSEKKISKIKAVQ